MTYPRLSPEQEFFQKVLNQKFQTWGFERTPVKLYRTLYSGEKVLNNGNDATAKMFGFKR